MVKKKKSSSGHYDSYIEDDNSESPGSGQLLTEKKQGKSDESKFSAIFTTAPLAMSVASVPDGKTVDVNNAWLRLTGYNNREDVIGKTSVELGLIPDPASRKLILEELRRNGSARGH